MQRILWAAGHWPHGQPSASLARSTLLTSLLARNTVAWDFRLRSILQVMGVLDRGLLGVIADTREVA